jgi:hypothetical protein
MTPKPPVHVVLLPRPPMHTRVQLQFLKHLASSLEDKSSHQKNPLKFLATSLLSSTVIHVVELSSVALKIRWDYRR